MSKTQNYINHIALVLDGSLSMDRHRLTVPQVADNFIKELAAESTRMEQETRITVYRFSDRSECLIYDKDVLRMPSIADLYRIGGNTALCGAATLAVKDLQLTAEKYGEHAFLIHVITDGQENVSTTFEVNALPGLINTLPDHWTLAAFVPDAKGVFWAKKFGFPAGNIAVWDTSDSFTEVGETIKQATSGFMRARTKGVHGTKTLFTLNTLNVTDIKKNLTPMTPGSYWFETVTDADCDAVNSKGLKVVRIDKFCKDKVGSYVPGMALYEMTARTRIQDYKKLAVQVPADNHLYVGKGARGMLGLPETGDVRVSPGRHKDYKLFIQSTSENRNLFPGTDLLFIR
jgi:hypothetical protein